MIDSRTKLDNSALVLMQLIPMLKLAIYERNDPQNFPKVLGNVDLVWDIEYPVLDPVATEIVEMKDLAESLH